MSSTITTDTPGFIALPELQARGLPLQFLALSKTEELIDLVLRQEASDDQVDILNSEATDAGYPYFQSYFLQEYEDNRSISFASWGEFNEAQNFACGITYINQTIAAIQGDPNEALVCDCTGENSCGPGGCLGDFLDDDDDEGDEDQIGDDEADDEEDEDENASSLARRMNLEKRGPKREYDVEVIDPRTNTKWTAKIWSYSVREVCQAPYRSFH